MKSIQRQLQMDRFSRITVITDQKTSLSFLKCLSSYVYNFVMKESGHKHGHAAKDATKLMVNNFRNFSAERMMIQAFECT